MMRLWKENKRTKRSAVPRSLHAVVLDMFVRAVKQLSEDMRRRARRYFLMNPETAPRRYAMLMASAVLVSIVITYNVLFERRKKTQGE